MTLDYPAKQTCKLCNKAGALCKAHLLPKAFFRYIYPENKIAGNSIIKLEAGQEFLKRRRVGSYDENILCSDCDNFLGSKYDEYGKKVFLDSEPQLVHTVGEGRLLQFGGVNAGRLKLFILSVLWRFSISGAEDARNVCIPNKFQKSLKDMLLRSDPGDADQFSVVITRYAYNGRIENLHKFFVAPYRARMDGVNFWRVSIPNGYSLFIKVDKRPQPKSLCKLTLSQGGAVLVLMHEYFEASKEFETLMSIIG